MFRGHALIHVPPDSLNDETLV